MIFWVFSCLLCWVIFQLDLDQNQVPHVAMQMLSPKTRDKAAKGQEEAVNIE